MVSNKIFVSEQSFASANKYELIYSNIHCINQLFHANIDDDRIYEEALMSYYIDSYLAQIIFAGFATFVKESSSRPKYLYYIRQGLKAIQATKNLRLLDEAFASEDKSSIHFRKIDKNFETLQAEESLVSLHYTWLINHPRLEPLPDNELEHQLERLKYELATPQRHIALIKKLCQEAQETYLRVTAGDPNNPYQNAWHFKTTSGYYYMIEKEGTAAMFHSQTKEKVTELNSKKRVTKYPNALLKRSSA